MEFTMVDGGVALIAVLSGYLAYTRGFTRELLAIGGWLAAAVVAALATPHIEPLIREAPVVGDFLASSCILSVIAAFTIVMAIGLLLLAVFTPIFSALVLDSVLGPIDRVLGFVFGIARGVILVAVAYLLYAQVVGDPNQWEPLANAESREVIEEVVKVLSENLPNSLPTWVTDHIDAMMSPCGNVPVTAPATES